MSTEKELLLKHLMSLSPADLRAELINAVGEERVTDWSERIHSFMSEGCYHFAAQQRCIWGGNDVYADLPIHNNGRAYDMHLCLREVDMYARLELVVTWQETSITTICKYRVCMAAIDPDARLQAQHPILSYYTNEWRYLALRVVAHIWVELLC